MSAPSPADPLEPTALEVVASLAADDRLAPGPGASAVVAVEPVGDGVDARALVATEQDPLQALQAVGDDFDQRIHERPTALGLLTWIGVRGRDDERPTAVLAAGGRVGGLVAASGDRPAVTLQRAPGLEDPDEARLAWRLAVHLHAALDQGDLLPPPPPDPHPGAYLVAAWLDRQLEAGDDRVAELSLPDWEALLTDLGLDVVAEEVMSGWRAVAALMARSLPDRHVERLGTHGVAWDASALLGDPGARFAELAARGQVEAADRLFAQLLASGWARRAGDRAPPS